MRSSRRRVDLFAGREAPSVTASSFAFRDRRNQRERLSRGANRWTRRSRLCKGYQGRARGVPKKVRAQLASLRKECAQHPTTVFEDAGGEPYQPSHHVVPDRNE